MANVAGGIGPPTSERTLREILECYGKTIGKNEVLDPEHPLMIKFQNDLNAHLLALHKETDLQLKELQRAVRDKVKENDGISERMSTLQKQLMDLKKNEINVDEEKKKNAKKEVKSLKKFNDVKESHQNLTQLLQEEREKDLELQQQLEDLSLEVVQLKNLQMEKFADSATMKGALKKTARDRENLEIEKLRQDMLISSLMDDQNLLQDKINLYKSQWAIKKQELEETQNLLSTAGSDLESIRFERLQLIQEWSYSIASLEKRDATSATMRESVRQKEDDLVIVSMDITNHKKLVRKELQENEKLTMHLLQRESEIRHIEELIKKCKAQQRCSEEYYVFFEQIIAQMEQDLSNLTRENTRKEKEVAKTERDMGKISEFLRKLEDEKVKILSESMEKEKTADYNNRELVHCRRKINSLEGKCVLKDGESSKLRLRVSETKNRIQVMEDQMAQLKKDIAEKEKVMEKSEAEIAKGHQMIEKKQMLIIELNNRLLVLINAAGGMELGPMEREIANIKKEIAHSDECRKFQEQEWLRYQRQLVALTNSATAHTKDVEMLRKKEAVLEETKIRISAELAHEENEIKELHRTIDRSRNDMARLTTILHREKSSQERLETENNMVKGDFLSRLKGEEMEFIKKDNEIESLKKKHAQLMSKLMHAQREILSWEGKLQLAEEAKKLIKSESHAKEIAIFNSEIRRLQVRWEDIKKEEARLIQDMEKAAFSYATLYVKADCQSVRGVTKKTNYYFETKLERLKRKTAEDNKEMDAIMKDIGSKNLLLYEMKKQEEDENSAISNANEQIKQLDQELKEKERKKWQDIITLSYKQKKCKLLQQIKDKKYIWTIRKSDQRSLQLDKLHRHFSSLKEITELMMDNYPDMKEKLLKIIDHIIVSTKL